MVFRTTELKALGRGENGLPAGGGGVGKGAPMTDLLLNPYVGSLSTPFWGPRRKGLVTTLPTCGRLRAQGLCSLNRNKLPPVHMGKVRGTGMA